MYKGVLEGFLEEVRMGVDGVGVGVVSGGGGGGDKLLEFKGISVGNGMSKVVNVSSDGFVMLFVVFSFVIEMLNCLLMRFRVFRGKME